MTEQIDLDFDTVDPESDLSNTKESTEPPAEVIITPEATHSYLLTFSENELKAINNALPILKNLGVISEDAGLDKFIGECFARGLKEVSVDGIFELCKSCENIKINKK